MVDLVVYPLVKKFVLSSGVKTYPGFLVEKIIFPLAELIVICTVPSLGVAYIALSIRMPKSSTKVYSGTLDSKL